MRVLVVGNIYPPHDLGGGYELVWRSAVDHLLASGTAVRVLASDHRGPDVVSEVGDIHRELRMYWRDHRTTRPSVIGCLRIERHNARVLLSHLEAFRPDVVSWWSMGALSMSLIERVRCAGLPAVGFVHDDWLDYGRRADGWHRRFSSHERLAALAERLTSAPTRVDFASAARWVFVSRATRDRARLAGLDLPDTGVAHSGIDPALIAPSAEREWRWQLLYVGRIDPRKGLDTAIGALAHLPAEATLTVVGDGERGQLATLRDQADKLGVRVEFLGRRAQQDIAPLYDATDVVVFPVRWEEPWGLVPLEAMARGRPVLATGRGGSGEYLRDGENCLLFPAGDAAALAEAIRRLSRDPHLRRGLRERGLTAANRHTATAFNRTVETELAGALEAWRDAGATKLESSGPP